MSKYRKPLPYDAGLIAEQCDPLTLRVGFLDGCW